MENILILLGFTAALSALGVFIILPRLIKYLKARSVVDLPNHRSSHSIPTPTMGGLSFFIGLIVVCAFYPTLEIVFVVLLIALSGLLGFWDDKKDISPKLKFLGQGFIATGFFFLGFTIAPLIELMLGVSIPFYLDWVLTVVFMLGLINAFNLIDGVDGLLTGVTLIASITFVILFYLQGNTPFLFLSAGMVGVSASFLIYNFQPAKIFMGDTGSLFIGTYISCSILKVSEGGEANYSLIAISLILIACVDMLRLFIGRYLILKKPFTADRNHMHHILLKMGWTHKRIVLNIYLFQLSVTVVAICLPVEGNFLVNLLMIFFLCLGIYGVFQLMLYRKRYKRWKQTLKMRNNLTKRNHLLKSHVE